MAKTIILIAGLLIAGALPLGAQTQPQQSLGDLARQLRKQHGKEPKATKVFTNDNLPEAKPGEAVSILGVTSESNSAKEPATAKPGSAEAEDAASHESKPSEDKTKTREYWQAKFKAARQDLAKAKQQQQLSEDELNLLQIQQVREIDPAAKSDLTAKVEAKQSDVQVNTDTTQAAQTKLDNLMREFKDSGAPEDWSNTEEPSTPPAS